MQITFYQMNKRTNSTKLPDAQTPSQTLSCELKEETNMINPSLIIKDVPTGWNVIWNYCYIPLFRRYYFIDNWRWENGVWDASTMVDVLASYKTQIGQTQAYIERCSSENDGYIVDNLFPATTDFSTQEIALDSTYYRIAPSGGCFVLGIINNYNWSIPQAGGAVTYYAMSVAEMRNLMGYLMSDNFLDDSGFPATPTMGQQILQQTAKAFINPMQYITSCMWFPLDVSDIAEAQPSNIVFGFWELEFAQNHIDGHKLEAFAFTSIVEETIPDHPQITRGRYLNYAPFTRVTLHIPPFGTIPLDTSYLSLGNYMKANIYVDTITGKAQMRVTIQPSALIEDNACVVAEASAMFGIPIQLSQMLPDYLNGFSALVQAGTQLASGLSSGSVGGAGLGALLSMSSIGNALDGMMPQVITQGVSGSFVQNIIPPSMTVQHVRVVDDNLAELGRPLCKNRTINTLSGFIKCGEVSINYACLLPEKQLILDHLINGFFWE